MCIRDSGDPKPEIWEVYKKIFNEKSVENNNITYMNREDFYERGKMAYAIEMCIRDRYPDIVAYPMMVISVVLMMIGIAYNGYCFGKKKL